LIDPWKESREKYLQAWQDAGWKCVLWHNGQLGSELATQDVELRHISEIVPGSIIEDVFNYELRHNSHACCADLLRYLLMYELGGAYSDIDIIPGLNARPTLPEGPLFGASNPRRLEIRFIRAPKGHPLLLEIAKAAISNEVYYLRNGGYSRGYVSAMDRTGPVVADTTIESWAKRHTQSITDYILDRATFDFTEENRQEGHHLRIEEIMKLADVPGWGSQAKRRFL
jgi:mannosyltransferase OCH1-like enzyme